MRCNSARQSQLVLPSRTKSSHEKSVGSVSPANSSLHRAATIIGGRRNRQGAIDENSCPGRGAKLSSASIHPDSSTAPSGRTWDSVRWFAPPLISIVPPAPGGRTSRAIPSRALAFAFEAPASSGTAFELIRMTSVAATPFLPVATSVPLNGQSLVVSLHDVAPATWNACKNILAELQRSGVHACSLLVVPGLSSPRVHLENRAFVSWLQGIGIGGARNRHPRIFSSATRRAGKLVRQTDSSPRFIPRMKASFSISTTTKRGELITGAREEFEQAGLKPHGFMAPAWLLGR